MLPCHSKRLSQSNVLWLLLALGERHLDRAGHELLEEIRIEPLALFDVGDRRNHVVARWQISECKAAVTRRARLLDAARPWRPIPGIGRERDDEVLRCGRAGGVQHLARDVR